MPASVPRVARRTATIALLGVAPALLGVVLVALVVAHGRHHTDFLTFWQSGRDVLRGRSPYPAPASLPRRPDPATFAPFVYPPVTAFILAPFSLLPFGVASVLFVLVDLAAVALALRLLGVTDWRCYGAAYASVPVFAGAALGAVSPLLLLGVAAAWRYRDRAAAAGLLVASVITAKLFLWPLWFWLVRTRRLRAAAVAAVASLAAVGASWAAIGFRGLADYPRLLARLTELVAPGTYSPYALARSLRVPHGAAELAAYAAGVAGVVVLLRLAGDRRTLTAALAISLVATPILWPHYLVLLFAPIALARRTLSALWLAPLLLWVEYSASSGGSAVRIAGTLALAGLVLGAALRGRRAAVQVELPEARPAPA